MSPSGRVSIVYTFKGDKDAGTPQGGLLFYKGNFYGTSSAGGSYACYFSYGCGTVFEISPSGHETILHVFQGAWTDGALPQAGLVALNGVLYGTTLSGGSMNCGLTYYLPCGTVFAVTLSGHEKIIHNFAGGTDGAYPNQLTVVGGTLYGTTEIGGAGCNDGFGCGTVFALTPSGQETIVHSFAGTPEDGDDPTSAPIEAGGTLYGTTAAGGTSSDGTLYALRP
jgi:uncharacterized repeat protein (TIGR03803 family)